MSNIDAAEVKRQRKLAKRAAAELEEAKTEQEVDAVEAKRLRKAAKRAAAEEEANQKHVVVEEVDAEAVEAKRQRKAARRAAKEAANFETEAKVVDSAHGNKLNVEDSAQGATIEANEENASMKKQKHETIGKGSSKGKHFKEFEVFVGGLPDDATDEDVKRHFGKCGSIVGFNMPRGSDGKHRGKAFLEFECKEAYENALQMNDTLYKLRLLVVQTAAGGSLKAKKEGDAQKWRKDLEVVVGGLPFSMTEDMVKNKFSGCGKIVALRMPSHLKKKGVAFIAFSNKKACSEALSFHGSICDGRPLYVHMSGNSSSNSGPSEKEKPSAVSDVKRNNEFEVFVGGLPFSTTEIVLRKDFSECGELNMLRMVLNNDGSFKGSAFLEYKNKESCAKALAFDGTEYGGRLIRVRMSADSPKDEKGKGKDEKGKGKGKNKSRDGKSGKGNKELEIVVTGLPFSTTSEVLRKDFEECGDIRRLVMPLTDEGNAKGNAYIEFADKEACKKALEFNDTSYGGRWIRVRMSSDRNTVSAASNTGSANSNASEHAPKAKVVTFDSDDD